MSDATSGFTSPESREDQTTSFYTLFRQFVLRRSTSDAMKFPAVAKSVLPLAPSRFRYSICTMVTDLVEYEAMVESFVSAGFDPGFCEFLYCDNSQFNQLDAYQAYNLFLRIAGGENIILCHQDVLLKFDRREALDQAILEMNRRDRNWALLGNAGGISPGRIALRITQSDGKLYQVGAFPVKAQSLDENFIVVKRSANLSLSHDLKGFHLYGTDLCQIAAFRGLTAYVIDFHLMHKSRGSFDGSFRRAYRAMSKKYQTTHRDGSIQTMGALLPTGRSRWQVQKALFFRIQNVNKLNPDRPYASEGVTRLKNILGPHNYFLHFACHKIMSPFGHFLGNRVFVQPVRALFDLIVDRIHHFQQGRAIFLRLRHLEKQADKTPESRREQTRLRKKLGRLGRCIHLIVYKMISPFANLIRSAKKRAGSRY